MMQCLLPVLRNSALALVAVAFAGGRDAPAQTVTPAGPFDCLIEPSRVVRLESPVDGILRDVRVDRGSFVQAGDVVATVDSRFQKATVDLLRFRAEDMSTIVAHEAQMEFALVQLDRARQLLERDAIPRGQVEELQAAFRISEAELAAVRKAQELAGMELRRAETDMERYAITSPMDGLVTRRIRSAGESVYQDREIAEIALMDPLHVEVFLPVAMYPHLGLGQVGSVLPDLPGAIARQAVIDVIDRVLDPTSNTFGVRLTLTNSKDALPAGLRCQLSFTQ